MTRLRDAEVGDGVLWKRTRLSQTPVKVVGVDIEADPDGGEHVTVHTVGPQGGQYQFIEDGDGTVSMRIHDGPRGWRSNGYPSLVALVPRSAWDDFETPAVADEDEGVEILTDGAVRAAGDK